MWMGTTVPMKGSSGMFTVDKVLEYIEENGDHDRDIIVKTDQENAIEFVVKQLMEARPEGKTIPENSAKQSSASNGFVKRRPRMWKGGSGRFSLGWGNA